VSAPGRARLIVALDHPNARAALEQVDALGDAVERYKVGLELYIAEGRELVDALHERDKRVFLDLKLHDIPNTVGRAAAAAVATGAAIVNCHASGGAEMMRAFGDEARQAAGRAGAKAPKLIAVTVLTSLDAAGLEAIGLEGSPRDAAVRLAVLARESGLDGVVCSPGEIAAIRSACGEDFFLVVPGVRPGGAASGDQKRFATPGDAVRAGADLLVVGRPITGASDPAAAARDVVAEIAAAL
jgi:orotidine-5'-phosphate decarboxylase